MINFILYLVHVYMYNKTSLLRSLSITRCQPTNEKKKKIFKEKKSPKKEHIVYCCTHIWSMGFVRGKFVCVPYVSFSYIFRSSC